MQSNSQLHIEYYGGKYKGEIRRSDMSKNHYFWTDLVDKVSVRVKSKKKIKIYLYNKIYVR